MKTNLLIGFFVTVVVYLFINGVCIFIGVLDAGYEFSRPCESNPRRIEVMFPGHKIGCWLGERVEDE